MKSLAWGILAVLSAQQALGNELDKRACGDADGQRGGVGGCIAVGASAVSQTQLSASGVQLIPTPTGSTGINLGPLVGCAPLPNDARGGQLGCIPIPEALPALGSSSTVSVATESSTSTDSTSSTAATSFTTPAVVAGPELGGFKTVTVTVTVAKNNGKKGNGSNGGRAQATTTKCKEKNN